MIYYNICMCMVWHQCESHRDAVYVLEHLRRKFQRPHLCFQGQAVHWHQTFYRTVSLYTGIRYHTSPNRKKPHLVLQERRVFVFSFFFNFRDFSFLWFFKGFSLFCSLGFCFFIFEIWGGWGLFLFFCMSRVFWVFRFFIFDAVIIGCICRSVMAPFVYYRCYWQRPDY